MFWGGGVLKYRPAWFHIALWLLVCTVLFLAFDFGEILLLRPQSIHFWRQTDSLSFIAGFVKNGGGIFSPSVLNLQCGNGQTAAEFPIIYWVIANVSVLRENPEMALRGIYLVTHLIGLGFLYRTFLLFGIAWPLGISTVLLLASSCVLNYYAANFVPDAFAFGLSLTGIYFGLNGERTGNQSSMLVAAAVFALAALIKVQFLIYPAAIVSSHVVISFLLNRVSLKPLVMLLFPAVIAFGWFSFVRSYNSEHCATCFLTSIKPIWSLDSEQMVGVWSRVTGMWWTSYYYATAFHLLYAIAIAVMLLWKKVDRQLLTTTVLAILGCAAYLLLFFAQFGDHDYYVIAMVPTIGLLLACFGSAIKNEPRLQGRLSMILITAVVSVIALLSVNYGGYRVGKRYADGIAKAEMNENFHTIDMNRRGVPEDALVISYPDPTCNGTLYFMDRRGFTISHERFSPELISGFKARGASHIVTETDRVEILMELDVTEVGRHGSLVVLRFN